MIDTLNRYRPQMLSILRIAIALPFIAHGTQKLIGFPAAEFAPPLFSIYGLAGILELVGGALVLIGLFTRISSFVLSGLMAVAYFMAHAPQSFFPTLNGGDAAMLWSFIFLYLVFAGPGPWSVDARRAPATVPA